MFRRQSFDGIKETMFLMCVLPIKNLLKVGIYEAPVETLPISKHRPNSGKGTKIQKNRPLFGSTITTTDFSDRKCLVMHMFPFPI
jgi:hypothetical protein